MAARSASDHQWRNNGLGQSGFDLGPTQTYYTRPMPDGWSRPREVGQLADDAGRVRVGDSRWQSCRVSLLNCPLPRAAAGAAAIRARAGPERGAGRAARRRWNCVPALPAGAAAASSSTDSRVALVASEAEAAAVPETWETFLAAGWAAAPAGAGRGRIAAGAADRAAARAGRVCAGGAPCRPLRRRWRRRRRRAGDAAAVRGPAALLERGGK